MEKFQANVSIQVLPKVEGGTDEVIRVVDAVIAYIKSTGLNYFVGPTETGIEGDFEVLCDIVKECQLICIREGAGSVSTYVKYSYSPNEGVLSIAKKVTKHHE